MLPYTSDQIRPIADLGCVWKTEGNSPFSAAVIGIRLPGRYYRTELGLQHEPISPATSYVVILVIMSGAIPDCATACLLL